MSSSDIFRKVSENGGFLQIQLRDIAFVVSVLIAAASFLFGQGGKLAKHDTNLDNQIKNLTANVAVENETIKSTNQRVNDIDIKGTQAGQAEVRMQDEKNLETNRRITIMEATMTQGVGDIREIKTKMELLVNYFDEYRKGKK